MLQRCYFQVLGKGAQQESLHAVMGSFNSLVPLKECAKIHFYFLLNITDDKNMSQQLVLILHYC